MQATSHQQPAVKSRRSRAKHHAGVGGVVAVSVALMALVFGHNLGNAGLQSASAQAGFHASLPGDLPAGFSQHKLDSGPGVVAIDFRSNSDDRGYSITQKASAWNSTDLRQAFVAPADSQYQTVASAGKTIYLYGQQNATWIKDGVWYLVQTEGVLSDRQLIQLATSS